MRQWCKALVRDRLPIHALQIVVKGIVADDRGGQEALPTEQPPRVAWRNADAQGRP
jgi:hypothetical protein